MLLVRRQLREQRLRVADDSFSSSPVMHKSKFTIAAQFTNSNLFVSCVLRALAPTNCSVMNFLHTLACVKKRFTAQPMCAMTFLSLRLLKFSDWIVANMVKRSDRANNKHGASSLNFSIGLFPNLKIG